MYPILSRIFFLFFLFISSFQIFGQKNIKWADSVLATFSLDQKIGQLYMIAAYSNKDDRHTQEVEQSINKYHVGGLIFFQGTPNKQVYLTNYYQTISQTPLFIAQDAEWGVKMRLDNAPKYPYAMTLGASSSAAIAFQAGQAMGQELKRLGVHISFSPVADINNNPNNPIIGFRSFGENRENVAAKTMAMAHGLQSEQIIACAKHFPGHGNTSTDSHLDLPIILGNKRQLDSIELFPFKHAFLGGTMATMIGHIHVPGLDNTPNLPASLSAKIVTNLLRNELSFDGLAITDAMNMKGVTKFFKNGEADVLALLAGNDIILCPESIEKGVLAIKNAIKDGRISIEMINEKVLRILYYKQWVGLENYSYTPIGDITQQINAIALQSEVLVKSALQSITLVSNKDKFVPLNPTINYAFLSIGEIGKNEFYETLSGKLKLTRFSIEQNSNLQQCLKTSNQLKSFDSIIISFHKPSVWKNRSYGFSDEVIRLVNGLEKDAKACIVLFCNPYLSKYFSHSATLMVAFEDEIVFRQIAAQMLLGNLPIIGNLPFKPIELDAPTVPLKYFVSSGLQAEKAAFNKMDTTKLKQIDYMLDEVLYSGAAPGGQVLVARNGEIVYSKTFGRYSSDQGQLVVPNTIYDLASITKIFATSLMAMRLYDMNELNIDAKLSQYIPGLENKAVGKITIKELMLHQAGLPPWIPFYKSTLGENFNKIYSTSANAPYLLKVAPNMYMDTAYKSAMMNQVYNTTLNQKGVYKYSDLSMILLKQALENIAKISEDSFLNMHFYRPMNLKYTGFNLYKNYSVDSFAPTEKDDYFRNQTVQGYVHDMGAAMFGGVAGHAGLFSNTQDMFILSEMLRNNGNYNGSSYLSPATIAKFTSQQGYNSRRGLIFDKPDNRRGFTSPASDLAQGQVFGHTGFTGTCVWIDQSQQIVFIFLSNRTFPTQNNRKLIQANYREKIQSIVYQSLK